MQGMSTPSLKTSTVIRAFSFPVSRSDAALDRIPSGVVPSITSEEIPASLNSAAMARAWLTLAQKARHFIEFRSPTCFSKAFRMTLFRRPAARPSV